MEERRLVYIFAAVAFGVALGFLFMACRFCEGFEQATLLHVFAAFLEIALGLVVVEIFVRRAAQRRLERLQSEVRSRAATSLHLITARAIESFFRDFEKHGTAEFGGDAEKLSAVLEAHASNPASVRERDQEIVAGWYSKYREGYERLLREIAEQFKNLIPVLGALDRDLDATQFRLPQGTNLLIGSSLARDAIGRLLDPSTSRSRRRTCKYFLDAYLYIRQIRTNLETIQRSS